MMKLLNANFARLRMNVVFRIGMAVSAILGAALPTVSIWLDKTIYDLTGYSAGISSLLEDSMDFYCFSWVLIVVVFFALFSGIFVGTEYSDGTLRNKIAAGYSRPQIYFSNLITNAVAGCILYTLYMIINLCVGIPYTGGFQYLESKTIAMYIVYIYIILIAFSAIFTLISMLTPNQAAAAVLCVGLVVVLFAIPTMQSGSLQFKEFFEEEELFYGVTYAAGDYNPYYIGGIRRVLSIFFIEFLPGGPLTQLSGLDYLIYADNVYLNPVVMFTGAAFFAVVPTTVGVALFKRKELK